jgi:hypothetical protein
VYGPTSGHPPPHPPLLVSTAQRSGVIAPAVTHLMPALQVLNQSIQGISKKVGKKRKKS